MSNLNELLTEAVNNNTVREFFETNLRNKTITEICSLTERTFPVINTLVRNNDLSDVVSITKSVQTNFKNEFIQFIDSLKINYIKNTKISDADIDIYISDKKIAINLNEVYYHTTLFKSNSFHYKQAKDCEVNGVRLIQIYDYEWSNPDIQQKLKSLIAIALGKTKTRIYARDCEIRQISNAEAKPFNNANHLQNHRPAQVTYGLYYNDELQQLMSFSKTKYNRNLKSDNSWEIIRGCPGSNNIVVGGVSRLYKHFIKDYNPDFIFSYCDFNKFDGRGYEAIGMKFVDNTGPDMWYIINGNVVHRNPAKYKYNSTHAEARLYCAGSKKYLWSKNG